MRRHLLFYILLTWTVLCTASAQPGGELRFSLHADPKTFNPLQAADEASETVRYLTGGVLIRVNRKTQALEPGLAVSWKVLDSGRVITFDLRQGVSFSDGTPFSAEDVAFTMRALLDPGLHSPVGDSFRPTSGSVSTAVSGTHRITITFPAPVAGLERLFDQMAIESSQSPLKEKAVLGPFYVADYKAGSYVLLRRNPNYWKRDDAGRQLPYLEYIRLDTQQSRETEMLRFRRGEIHLINNLDPEMFERLAAVSPASARDAGPSQESEMMWFNQVPTSPVTGYKKTWFRSQRFRWAISQAINRDDIVRVVYHGHGSPALGPFSAANHFWFNASLKPHPFDPQAALRLLNQDGFRREADSLKDRDGHPVEFSLITNAGNKTRERIAAMVQQDLSQLGIRLNVVTLDFASLIERISRTFDYEACLLGLVNVDLDPNAQMNLWLSSADQHVWNPNQKSPETTWEAEIDRLMQGQAMATDPQARKAYFDRVQEIVWHQAPLLYLVTKNALTAISPSVENADPGVLWPQAFWNAERLNLTPEAAGGGK
jgi:peptide/nickel transport system substrate-binding protein